MLLGENEWVVRVRKYKEYISRNLEEKGGGRSVLAVEELGGEGKELLTYLFFFKKRHSF